MSKTIHILDDLMPALGRAAYAKISHSAALFNAEKDHNNRISYLAQLRGHARQVADASVEELKYSGLTTDQKVETMSDHRAAGHRVLALCDAVEI